VPLLHYLAIAAAVLAGPAWFGMVVAIRDCGRRDAGQASTERDTARSDDMRLAA
jgi:hypothetical protein